MRAVSKLGFKLPHFINYSYDDVADDALRFRKYAAEVRRVIRIPLGEWRSLWRQHLPLLRHNQRLFYISHYHRMPMFS
jgi:hypothetical protein